MCTPPSFSCTAAKGGGRYTVLVPELSLDVPDGTGFVTATVRSPLGVPVDSAKEDIPELGVAMVLAFGAIKHGSFSGHLVSPWWQSNTADNLSRLLPRQVGSQPLLVAEQYG